MTKEVPAPRWVPAPHSDKRTYQDLASYYRGDLRFLASCWRMMRSALDVKNYSIPTGLRSR